IINYDMPDTIRDYIHQIGRCGRGESHGWAISFINGQSRHLFRELTDALAALPKGRVTPLPPQMLHHG
ncbi:hypothetical protein HDU76_007821, partial [Blyttiomyces sp. JEL0837]